MARSAELSLEPALQFGFPDSFLKIRFGLCVFWQITYFCATRVTCPPPCMEQGDVIMFYPIIVDVNVDETSTD